MTLVVWSCPTCNSSSEVDHEDLQFVTCVQCELEGIPRRTEPRFKPCKHLSEQQRFIGCPGCGGSRIKVFGCDQFGECTIGKRLTGVACCNDGDVPCGRYTKDTKIRVGFVAVCHSRVGGTETWHRTLIPILMRQPNIHVVGFASTESNGGPVSSMGCPVRHGMPAAKELANSVDVLIEWASGKPSSLFNGERPAVITMHHGDVSNGWSKKMLSKRRRLADIVCCVNPDVAEEMKGDGFKACYIPNPVNDLSLPRQLAHHGRPIILWVGRISPEKRPNMAVDIARLMPDADFRIIGNGTIPRLPPNVTMVGERESPWDELSRASVLIGTSTEEGFGYAIAEAMLASVPVVATPRGIAAHNDICSTVTLDSRPEDWEEEIRYVLSATEEPYRQKLLRDARQFVIDNHDTRKVAAAWVALIEELAECKNTTL